MVLLQLYQTGCTFGVNMGFLTILVIVFSGVSSHFFGQKVESVNDNVQYMASAKREFASSADSWLCAYGLALGGTIVTLEKYDAEIKKRVKIPNVCRDFRIEYIDLLQFMREIGIRL